MMLPEFYSCPNCKSTLRLSKEERESLSLKCPACDASITENKTQTRLKSIASRITESDTFSVEHSGNTIQVLYLPKEELIALFNGEVIARKPIGRKLFSERHFLEFTAKENESSVPYRIEISVVHGSAYSMYCTVFRKNKKIFEAQNKSSKTIGSIIIVVIVISLIALLSM